MLSGKQPVPRAQSHRGEVQCQLTFYREGGAGRTGHRWSHHTPLHRESGVYRAGPWSGRGRAMEWAGQGNGVGGVGQWSGRSRAMEWAEQGQTVVGRGTHKTNQLTPSTHPTQHTPTESLSQAHLRVLWSETNCYDNVLSREGPLQGTGGEWRGCAN